MRRPPHELEVTICDLKFLNSRGESRNMKSAGKRGVTFHRLQEHFRGYFVQSCKMLIEYHLLTSNHNDRVENLFAGGGGK